MISLFQTKCRNCRREFGALVVLCGVVIGGIDLAVGRPVLGQVRVASNETTADNGDLSSRSVDSASESGESEPAPGSNGELIEAARIVATVGDQTILAGDLFPHINRFIEQRTQSLPESQRAMLTESVLNEQRWVLLKQLLPGAIDTKLAYLEFLRTIPAENLPKVMDELMKKYDEEELPKALSGAGVNSPADLDKKMRELGSSLEKERRNYAERLLAQAMIGKKLDRDQEVTHEELLDYYETHLDQYRYKAKARWEQLCTLRANHPSAAAARRKLAQMGNEVLHGAALEAVAQRSSEGFTAKDGGQFDWTEQGSLTSPTLDEALFSLPLGKLSEILEDTKGFHIIRVIERKPTGVIPFSEVQKEISEAIRKERLTKEAESYLQELRAKTPIWTLFGNDFLQQANAR